MASQTIKIQSFPQGYFMSWCVTTQAAFSTTVKLFDSSTVYFNATKKSTNVLPPLAIGANNIAGNNVQLTVDVPESSKLYVSLNNYSITATDGTIVGYGCNISIEDSNDNDYNDVCASLVAWKHKG